jgi:hypothetical protein
MGKKPVNAVKGKQGFQKTGASDRGKTPPSTDSVPYGSVSTGTVTDRTTVEEVADAYANLREAERNLRAASVESLGKDIFEPAEAPEVLPPDTALTLGLKLAQEAMAGNEDADLASEALLTEHTEAAKDAHSRGDDETARAHVKTVAGILTGGTFMESAQRYAAKQAGLDVYEGMDAEERQFFEAMDAMHERDRAFVAAHSAAGDTALLSDGLESYQRWHENIENQVFGG